MSNQNVNNPMYWFKTRCYEQWIKENIPKDEMCTNCTLWSRAMKIAFPELILVGGYVRGTSFFSAFNLNYHEYLIDEEGEIVDPTKEQFNSMLSDWYYVRCEEHLLYLKENAPVTGPCLALL